MDLCSCRSASLLPLFTLFRRTDVGDCGFDVTDQVIRCDFELQPANSRTDVDERLFSRCLVDVGRETLFHADGRTSAPNVSCHGQQLFHWYQIRFFVTRDAGCSLEVDLVIARNDADEIACAIAF